MNSGLIFYYNLLGLDLNDLLLDFQFPSGNSVISNGAPNFPQFSGALSSVGNFYNNSGYGNFTGQSLTIQNWSGTSSYYSHVFITNRSGIGEGILFDSLTTGSVYSGFSLGFNAANQLYVQSYDQNGPFCYCAKMILGKQNLCAVVFSNNTINFYSYDFNNSSFLTDGKAINGQYFLQSSKAVIGNTGISAPSFIEKTPFSGLIQEYIIIQEALTPSSLRYLCSGLASTYNYNSGIVSGFYSNEITGFTNGITGTTGITGYANIVTGTILDPFGTGNFINLYTTSGITGYFVSGLNITPLTGLVESFLTGDPTSGISLNPSFISGFYLDEITFLEKIGPNDISVANLYPMAQGGQLNLEANYNLVNGQFQLNNVYTEPQIEIYLNGISQVNSGYAVTGNFYNNQIIISGDYILSGFYLDSTGFYGPTDELIYDLFSGQKQRIAITNAVSGHSESLSLSGSNLVFFNGQLLISGLNYSVSGGNFIWATNVYSGASGALNTYSIPNADYYTGQFLNITGKIFRGNSQIYYNGQRQLINYNYLENSSIDLIFQSGVFDNTLTSIYPDDGLFFQTTG